MRYQGDADSGAAPGGQQRPPGRPAQPWPRAADGDQPGSGEHPAGWYAGRDGADDGTAASERADSWNPSAEGADDWDSGREHAGGWYSDGGYSDAGYGYGDGGYGGGRESGSGPGRGGAGADVTTAAAAMPAGAAGGASAAGTPPPGVPVDEHGRVLAASGAAAPGSVPPGSAFYGTAGGTAGKGPVRGFPPAPGQSAPVYPPGQFSAWNQPPAEAAGGRAGGTAGRDTWPVAASAEHGYAEPDYSVLAVSDPAADATATQTWSVADDRAAGSWQGASTGAGAGAGPAPGTERSPAGRRSRGHPAGRSMAPPRIPDQAGRRDGAHPAGPGAAAPGGTGQLPRPGAGQPGGPPERAAGRSARGRRARKPAARRARVLLAAGLAVVVAGTGTYFYLARGRQPARQAAAAPNTTPAATQPGTPSASPTPTGRWGHIQTRKTDPLKLTLHELFPVRFKTSGSSYSRTAVKAGKHCSSAVLGGRLQSAVSAAGCSQVMRASYLAGNRKLMGTIGVLNLKTARMASRAGKATGPSEFIAQLRGARGPTRRLNKGTGIEEAEVKGHYLILIWAEFANLHAPKTTAQRKELVQFCTRLLKNTANVSLSRRLVTGRP